MYRAIESNVSFVMKPIIESYESYLKESLKPIDETIATDIFVTSEWQDIAPSIPLKAHKEMWQTIFLKIEGFADNNDHEIWSIELENGTILKPEVQVEDLEGRIFDLKDNTRVGNLVGFSSPTDLTLRKIRIRSDRPFHCTKVIWSNKRPK